MALSNICFLLVMICCFSACNSSTNVARKEEFCDNTHVVNELHHVKGRFSCYLENDHSLIGMGETVFKHDIKKGGISWETPKQSGRVLSLAAHSDRGVVASFAENDDFVRLWDLASGQFLQALSQGSPVNPSMSFSGDGSELLVIDGCRLVRWDINNGQKLSESLLAVPEGSRITGGLGGSLPLVVLNHTIASYRDHELIICDTRSNKVVQTFRGALWVGEVLRDKRHVVVGGGTYDLKNAAGPFGTFTDPRDCDVQIFDIVTGEMVSKMAGHDFPISHVSAMSEESNCDFVTFSDGENRVLFWSAKTGRCVAQYRPSGAKLQIMGVWVSDTKDSVIVQLSDSSDSDSAVVLRLGKK